MWAESAELGKARRLNDAAGRYIEFCKSTFAHDLSLRGLRLVVDAAHGAAYQVAPQVFHELGAEVTSIGCAPDGLNINEGVGATHPGALVEAGGRAWAAWACSWSTAMRRSSRSAPICATASRSPASRSRTAR